MRRKLGEQGRGSPPGTSAFTGEATAGGRRSVKPWKGGYRRRDGDVFIHGIPTLEGRHLKRTRVPASQPPKKACSDPRRSRPCSQGTGPGSAAPASPLGPAAPLRPGRWRVLLLTRAAAPPPSRAAPSIPSVPATPSTSPHHSPLVVGFHADLVGAVSAEAAPSAARSRHSAVAAAVPLCRHPRPAAGGTARAGWRARR